MAQDKSRDSLVAIVQAKQVVILVLGADQLSAISVALKDIMPTAMQSDTLFEMTEFKT